jgi:hypothetical protein
VRKTVWRCLDHLTRLDLAALRIFAEHRLARVGLDPNLGADIVQDALCAVLRGLNSAKVGRHPRPSDLEDKAAFVNYLRGVINSLVAVERRKDVHKFNHCQLDGQEPRLSDDGRYPRKEIEGPVCVENDVDWRDLQNVFFSELRKRACPRLEAIISDWETVWRWSNRIPVPIPKRRLRKDIRLLARDVLDEIGEQLAT